MSHRATNWAVEQRGLKPATKIVLWHLADRHNPDHGCFPSQRQLAEDCEMSRSSINNHLTILEERGLVHRVQSRNEKTYQQENTRYLLAFEDGFPVKRSVCQNGGKPPKPCPETGHGNSAESVSKNGEIPCPKNAGSRVQNLDTNPVREPVREPVSERERASGGASAGECAAKSENEPMDTPEAETVTRDTWKRRFKKAHKDWPTFVSDSEDAAEKEWFALAEADREKAASLMAVYVHEVKASGRKMFCTFAVYLREKRWEKLSEKALRSSGASSVLARPYGKAWGALRFADLMREPYGHFPPPTRYLQQLLAAGGEMAEAERRRRTAEYGWPKVNTLHLDARNRHKGAPADPELAGLSQAFDKVAKGSALFSAWKTLHERRGWPWLGADRDLPDWIYMPAPSDPIDSYESLDEAVKAALARFENAHAELQKNEAAE